jgi:hypothetical protein
MRLSPTLNALTSMSLEVPQSAERDQIIQGCETLRARLLSSDGTPPNAARL